MINSACNSNRIIDSTNLAQTLEKFAITQDVKGKLADVLLYLVRLAFVLNVDLNEAIKQKIKANEQKYPVTNSLGVSTKYNKK